MSRFLIRCFCGLLVAAIWLSVALATAALKNWTVGDGNWSTPANWNSVGAPIAGDDAYINTSGTTGITVTYDYTGPAQTLNFLQIGLIGSNGAAANVLSISANNLASVTENVGGSPQAAATAVGMVNQAGGSNTIGVDETFGNDGLYLGNNSTEKGIYNLSGTGVLISTANSGEIIGSFGTGVFNQIGGSNTLKTSSLTLGRNPGSSGTYNLSGSGLLSVGFGEYVGLEGFGYFNQSGGTHTVTSSLNIGNLTASAGIYTLSGTGSLSVASGETVGVDGTGTFIQSGGTNNASEGLTLGAFSGSTGAYVLSGGTLSINDGSESIGLSTNGVFNQSGGVNTISANLRLGANPGASGTFTLSGGTLSVGNNEYLGSFLGNPSSGTFNQSGGTHTVSGNLFVGFGAAVPGSFTLTGGTVAVGGTTTLNNGTLLVDGATFTTGLLSGGSGNSIFLQSDPAGGAALVINDNNPAHLATYGDSISGGGTILKSGAATQTLVLSTGFTGQVIVSGGALVLRGAATAPSGLGAVTVNSGGVLQLGDSSFNNNVLGAPATGIANLNVNAGGSVATALGTSHNLGIVQIAGGTLSGSSVPLAGFGDYTLSDNVFADASANDAAGVSTISAAGGINLRNTIIFNVTSGPGRLVISAPIHDEPGTTGNLTKTGPGLLVISAAASYSGVTNISAGTLQLGDGVTANGTLAGNIFDNAALVFANPTAQTFSGAISGPGSVTKTAAGVLTLALHTFHAGGTVINGGTVVAAFPGDASGEGTFAGGSNVTVNTGGTLQLNGIDSLGFFSGSPVLNITGGIATTDGSVAHSNLGSVNLQGGTLAAAGNGDLYGNYIINETINSLPSSALSNISAAKISLRNDSGQLGGTFNVARGTAVIDLAILSNIAPLPGEVVGLTKTGNGILQLKSANTYNGNTTVSGGTLIIGGAGALPAGGNVVDNAIFRVDATNTAGNVSGMGTTLIANATTLTAANFTQGGLSMELAGAADAQNSKLNVTGTLTLGGTFTVNLVNSFAPPLQQSFDLLDWSTRSGTFSTLQLPALSGSLGWNVSNLYTTGTLSVIDLNRLPGDMNHDGSITAADFPLMELALTNKAAYELQTGVNDTDLAILGDADESGKFDNGDLQGLINELIRGTSFVAGSAPPLAVPEPPSISLLLIGAIAGLVITRASRRGASRRLFGSD